MRRALLVLFLLLVIFVAFFTTVCVRRSNADESVLSPDAVTVMSGYNSRIKLDIPGLPTDHWVEIDAAVKEFARLHPQFTEVTLVQVFWVPRDQFAPPRVQDQITGLLLTHRPKTTHHCEK